MSKAEVENKGMGMILAPDPRRMRYRMGAYMEEKAMDLPSEMVLENGMILDQGEDGTCVGHAWVAWENCRPRGAKIQQGHKVALEWYDLATTKDPWPDNDGDRSSGTSTQAGAEVALEWGLGLAYVWAETLEAVDAFICGEEGPVVMGTFWYRSMFRPDSEGYVTVDLASGRAGGHEWLLFGITEDDYGRLYHAQNSWGKEWADGGIFYLREEDMMRLFYSGGEACAVVQTGVLPR